MRNELVNSSRQAKPREQRGLHGPWGVGQQGVSSQPWGPAGLRAWGLLHTSMGDLARRPVGRLRCGH